MLIRIAETAVIQKLSELMNGNATSRAPICSGTMMFIRPIMNAIAMKKIMMTPCAVNT
ncbi:Uncharacterised protein [Burkholderia pseudomallei]|nr:Uncharacterised protein [Burkholderia pseudomallei]CAJ3337252.1 Uncharacterised protein [Burkholderia pseudomallei]CAJ3919215.1 Uncharacterised protein [Burkholderia pseudomallei]CAJ3934815.1 Uncharacterised protein [Burkholderia pseudomallei]CAJ4525575.1 Uncharacterised protein [Burkholderia pseudomallei]